MRGKDWNTAMAANAQWAGKATEKRSLCSLIADLDRLLEYLERIHMQPEGWPEPSGGSQC